MKRGQIIKCIPLWSGYIFQHEQKMTAANNFIQSMKNAATNLSKKLAEIKKKVDAIESLSSLQKKLPELMQEMKDEIEKSNNPEKLKELKICLNDSHPNLLEKSEQKIKEIDAAYMELLQNSQQDEKLTEYFQQRVEQFEEERVKWDASDVLTWLKLIEDEYFNDEEYETFFEQLVEMEVDGEKLPELNSKILLDIMGLDLQDQSTLLRNLCRVCENWTGSKRRDICGMCVEKRINSVMVPCGHQYMCFDCLEDNEIHKCPICRTPITQKLKTFLNGF